MCVLIAVDMGTLLFLLYCELFNYKPRRENLPYPVKQYLCLLMTDMVSFISLRMDGVYIV